MSRMTEKTLSGLLKTTGQRHASIMSKPTSGASIRRSKYKNTRCEYMGEKFDSKKELNRHLVLLDMQKRGEISQLLRQPKYPLIVNGFKICDYIGDWFYWEERKGRGDSSVIEDAKGFQTPEFKLKWKLCQALYPHIDWRLS